MNTLVNVIAMLAQALSTVVVIWMLIGLLFAFNIVGRDNQFLYQVERSIAALLAPMLGPIRRFMPDTGAIDFSPMVLLLLINATIMILQGLV